MRKIDKSEKLDKAIAILEAKQKKDFIELQKNQQIYEIPAGREINELLWFTPAELTNILFDPWSFGAMGGPGLGGPGGYSQIGYSGSYFLMPAFDML